MSKPRPKLRTPLKGIQTALTVKDSQTLLVWDREGNVSLVPVRNQWVPERDGPVVMALLDKLIKGMEKESQKS